MKERELALLLDRATSLTVEGDGGEIEIEPIATVKLPERIIVRTGCCVTYADKTLKIKGDKKLIKFLEENGGIADGEIKVSSIGSDRVTEAEYYERLAFDKLDMAGIVEKYLPLADSFSLTAAYGEYNVTEELAARALKKMRETSYKDAERQFMLVSEEERSKLPSFKTIYSDIEKEYSEYCRENSALIEANDGYACFSDIFSGNRIYSSVDELRHAYAEVDFAGTCEYVLEKLKKCERTRPLDEELDGAENACLKENLINIEVTFDWHCTRGELSKVFYIKSNDKTVEWLKKFKSDYDLGELEDLAFYKNGKTLFSSCTHEKFHVDYTGAKK